MKQIITIKGTPIETYDDSVIQLDYKSNILGEIDKIEACHSYTYAIPNTTKNKALFRLSDVSDSEKKTNQFIPDVELFFNGIKIADGQIYIADVTPDEISIVFLFGMFSALKRIKDDDRKLYELAYKSGDDMHAYNYAMYAGGDITRTPTKAEDGFSALDFYTFFCWAQGTAPTPDKIEEKYFPLAIKIKTLNNKIQDLYKCMISGGEIADNIPEYMMYKPKSRKYFDFSMYPKKMHSGKSSSGEDMYFLYKSVDWEITDLYGNVTTQDYNSGDEPFSMTFKADVEITNISISFATATPFYVLVNVEIDKIETCHSYTYAIPNTTKNKALFRLSDVSDSEKKTNQFIPDVELFFNGIKIADGQIYIADVTPDEISIVFLFGMFSALKRIKDDDRKLYELAYKPGDDMHAYNHAMYTGQFIHFRIVTGKQIGRAHV